MSEPLYKLKGEFFKTLGHPARVRVLELLSDGARSVGELLPEVGLEASHLSHQLGILRRAGVVQARKQGGEVIYSLASPEVAELLRVARAVLTGILATQSELLDDLRADANGAPGASAKRPRPTAERSPAAGRSPVTPRA